MALVKCKECGKEVAKSAKTCPHCGVKSPHRTTISAGAGCLIIIILIVGGALMVGDMESPGSTSSSRTSPTRGPGQVHHARRVVNVREGPGTSHPVAYSLSIGDWTYVGQTNADGWAVVYGGPGTSDTVGFVYAQLLRRGRAPDLMLLDGWECGAMVSRYSEVIRGSVKNTTMRAMDYVQISFNLLDAQDRHLGTAWTNTTNLAANGVWVFEAHIMKDGVRRCRLAEVTGY